LSTDDLMALLRHTGRLRLLGGVRIVRAKSEGDRSVTIVGNQAHRHEYDRKEEDG
jgi:hypothetical protein